MPQYWWENSDISTVDESVESIDAFEDGNGFSNILSGIFGAGAGIFTGGLGTQTGSQIGGLLGNLISNNKPQKGKPWIGKPSQNIYGVLFGNYGGEIYDPKQHPDFPIIVQTLMNAYRINNANLGIGDAEWEASQIINGFKPLTALDTEFGDQAKFMRYYNPSGNEQNTNANAQNSAKNSFTWVWIAVSVIVLVGIVSVLVMVFTKKKKKD